MAAKSRGRWATARSRAARPGPPGRRSAPPGRGRAPPGELVPVEDVLRPLVGLGGLGLLAEPGPDAVVPLGRVLPVGRDLVEKNIL